VQTSKRGLVACWTKNYQERKEVREAELIKKKNGYGELRGHETSSNKSPMGGGRAERTDPGNEKPPLLSAPRGASRECREKKERGCYHRDDNISSHVMGQCRNEATGPLFLKNAWK